MFKTSDVVKSTFNVEIENDDGGAIRLSVLPPKMKVLRKMEEIDEKSPDVIGSLSDIVSDILGSNREKITVTRDDVEEWFRIDEIVELLNRITEWIAEVKHDPN